MHSSNFSVAKYKYAYAVSFSIMVSPLLSLIGFHFTLAKIKYMLIDDSDSSPIMTVATEQLERNGSDITVGSN